MQKKPGVLLVASCVFITLTGCNAGSASAPNTTNKTNEITTSNSTSSSGIPLSEIPTKAFGTLHSLNGNQAQGKAELQLDLTKNVLTVKLTLSGLKPGAKYSGMITIGQGGGTVYTLSSGAADGNGNLSITSILKGVNGIPGNWYACVVPAGSSSVASTAVASGAIMPD